MMAKKKRQVWATAAWMVASYLVLIALGIRFPSVYPNALSPLLPSVVRFIDEEYTMKTAQVEDGALRMELVSLKLARFKTGQGKAGPEYGFVSRHNVQLMNIYPAIALALLLAWPLTILRKSLAVLLCLFLLGLCTSIDAATMAVWSGAELYPSVWKQVGASIPGTPANADVAAHIQRQFEHLTLLKSFFSTGGRQFLAALAAAISIGVALWVPTTPANKEEGP